ncbi:MAG: hypothetical protein ACM3S2_15265 [Ignavibacteriales bacterium]
MKGTQTQSIFRTLQLLENNKLSANELNCLAKYCCDIAYVIVMKKKWKMSALFCDGEFSFRDFAIRAVTPLFTADESSEYAIKVAYKNWDSPISSQTEAIEFLNKLIESRIEQYFYSYLRNSDPLFSRLLNFVLRLGKKSGLDKITRNGSILLVRPGTPRTNQRSVDEDNFCSLPSYLFSDRNTMLLDIISYLEAETDFFPAVPVNMLVRRLKSLKENEYFISSMNVISNSGFEIDDMININDMVSFAVKKSTAKLEKSYLRKNKLDVQETGLLKAVIKDMATDIKDGGTCRGLHKYLDNYINNMNRETYESKYQNILEYLLKTIKLTIAESMVN